MAVILRDAKGDIDLVCTDESKGRVVCEVAKGDTKGEFKEVYRREEIKGDKMR